MSLSLSLAQLGTDCFFGFWFLFFFFFLTNQWLEPRPQQCKQSLSTRQIEFPGPGKKKKKEKSRTGLICLVWDHFPIHLPPSSKLVQEFILLVETGVQREWKKEMLLKPSLETDTPSFLPHLPVKASHKASSDSRDREKQSTFWWEELQTLITKGVRNREDGEWGLLLQLI